MSTFLLIFNVLGSVSLFLYGMKVMSEGVQRSAGGQLQKFLNRMTQNQYSGVLAGTVFTGALQSSSIVSVLTLSFVNAGLLNLRRAFSIIVGANVGTVIKLWFIIGLGTVWHIESLALPMIAVAVTILFFRNQRAKEWSDFFIGLALIFIGFYFLNQFFPDLTEHEFFYKYIQEHGGNTSFGSSLIFVLIGIFVTFLFHSSSAFTLLAAVLVSKGMNIEQAAMMVLGANIGTTSAALIASTVGNRASKITAWFHFFFNLAGVVLIFFFVPFIIDFLREFVSTDGEILLVSFHTFFNVVSAFLILPFINSVADWAENKYWKSSRDKSSLKLIARPFGPTAKMYVYEANREIVKFAGITRQIISNLGRMISESDEEKLKELRKRIFTLEKESDELEKSILNYLNSIYNFEMSGEVALNIHRLIEICHHLENVGDLAIKIASIHQERRKSNSFITPKLRELLLELQDSLSMATTTLVQNLNETDGNVDLLEAKQIEKSIDKKFEKAEEALLKAIESEKLSARSALFYTELIQNYELIGDHLYQANRALGK
ncbi:Na/Pi cotransporter family protein [Moheibacter lacus]|uniref:Na/Pi cotransporter family protein n=1 Tax=Moheibacter lacus TaxID=2745851 RepID=A0A838ZQW5_9FLAO|nr:Na/Pi symporter [Moheibacter lacus]MBA5628512.1 Na/Pi cotransporter family protein [Moheibacter lacus]